MATICSCFISKSEYFGVPLTDDEFSLFFLAFLRKLKLLIVINYAINQLIHNKWLTCMFFSYWLDVKDQTLDEHH